MIDSILWGFFLGILGFIGMIWGFLLLYIPIFYLYNRFIDKNAIYAKGFLKYYFWGYALVFILFECYIALYVPFDYNFFDEDNATYYPIQSEYAEYNKSFGIFMPVYVIGIPIAFYLTKLINKLHKINQTPQILHRDKTIIFGILAPSALLLYSVVDTIPITKNLLELLRGLV